MYVLDGVNNMTMSVDEVCALDATRLTDPAKFRSFAQGIELTEDFLMSPRWQHSSVGQTPNDMLAFVMHEMLPVVYNPEVLQAAGGSFAIRITGVSEFTLMLTNHRVVVISGLPVDFETSEPTLDFEIAPDVLVSHCRYLMLQISEDILEDDEFENIELSDSQLRMMGMPAGGAGPEQGVEKGDAGFLRPVSGNMLEGSGKIDTAGDSDLVAVQVFKGTTYYISARAVESGKGTLVDPKINGIYDLGGNQIKGANSTRISQIHPNTKEAGYYWTPPDDGVYYISVGSDDPNGTGTYSLSAVSINEHTYHTNASAIKNTVDWSDGRVGWGDRFGTTYSQEGGIFVNMGRIDYAWDRDIIRLDLNKGVKYEIGVGDTDDKNGDGNLDAKIVGLYGTDGTTYHSGNDDISSSNSNARIEFTAPHDGTYLLQVAGEGTSTGTYNIIGKVLRNVEVAGGGGGGGGYTTIDNGVIDSSGSGGCFANASGCGSNSSLDGFYAINASYCGKAVNAYGACPLNASFCGQAVSGIFGCGANASACGQAITGSFTAAADVWVCGVAYSGAFVSAANASACGVAVTGGYLCGANASAVGISTTGIGACGANASATGISVCGAAACGANASTGLISVGAIGACGLNSNACAADINVPCAADATACGLNLAWGADFGVCAINIFPILPSC